MLTATIGGLLLPAFSARAQPVAALKSAGVLRAGVRVSQAPWGFMDTSGRNEGFEIELLRAFGAELGINPEFTPVTTSTRIPALPANKIDVIAAVTGQTELATAFNDFLARKLENGELATSYRQWAKTDMAELSTTGDTALPIIMAPY